MLKKIQYPKNLILIFLVFSLFFYLIRNIGDGRSFIDLILNLIIFIPGIVTFFIFFISNIFKYKNDRTNLLYSVIPLIILFSFIIYVVYNFFITWNEIWNTP